jgi:predicted amidohydrolase
MSIRAASIQLPFSYFSTPQEFADHVRAPIELAAQNGAQIILLPHLTSFMLFGMFDFDATPTDSLDQLAQRQNVSTAEWLNERAGYVFEFYLHLFQSLASRVETWLAPGTVLEPEGDALYPTAFLMNPAGEIVGRQRQMHRTAHEIEWGVSQGDTLRVFETELGDFGFVIGEDVHYPEVARALALNGADVLLHPTAQKAETLQRNVSTENDIWQDVQSNQTFGVQANLVGGTWRGRSAVYAPVEMTADKRGVLVRATSDSDGEMISADLDFEGLQKVRTDHPVLDLMNRDPNRDMGKT